MRDKQFFYEFLRRPERVAEPKTSAMKKPQAGVLFQIRHFNARQISLTNYFTPLIVVLKFL